MSKTPISLFLLRRLTLTSKNPRPPPLSLYLLNDFFLKPYSTSGTANPSTDPPKPSSLSARMSFIFDQIDAIERERTEKHEALQRIRAWRQSRDAPRQEQQEENPETIRAQNQEAVATQNLETIHSQNNNSESGVSGGGDSIVDLKESDLIELKKEVELVHPWPEWIELMERLLQQNYFDHRRKVEDRTMESLGVDISGIGTDSDGVEIDFNDYRTVQIACLNFGKDRFDILRSLSRQDIQILVGYGCPSVDKKVVFSAKLLRKRAHLDEGDVCSNCSLRSSCERGYLLTNKEDEARTIDLMRVLLAYGFGSINRFEINKSLLKQKSVKTIVRKLLHEVVKLSAVPIDPNLPPPVIKRSPPKVKQPPPPPKKRVGRYDIEMKKGDWLCPKCDFVNFAKNTVCLQCDAKRPKRQLLPGEWECPECNFLNYRRNMACFHCDCNRPPDAFMENKLEERQPSRKPGSEKIASRPEVTNAWNFDFDDDESDGADVAAFEYADSAAVVEDSPLGHRPKDGNFREQDDFNGARRISGVHEREYSDSEHNGYGRGFDDFDDEDDIDSYELDTQNNKPAWKASGDNFYDRGVSKLHDDGGSDDNFGARFRKSPAKPSKPKYQRAAVFSGSDEDELVIDSDEERSVHPRWKSSHVADVRHKNRGKDRAGPSKGLSYGSDEEHELDSDVDDDFGSTQRKNSKKGSLKRNFQRNADWEDVSGSESDDNDKHSWRNRSRGNKMEFGRRGNNFRDRDFDLVRDTEMRPKGKMGDRRKSRGDGFGRSSPGPQGKTRGFRGNDRSTLDMNDEGGDSWDSKGPKRGFRKMNDAGGDSWDSKGPKRGFRKKNDAGGDSWDFKGPKREGFRKRQGGRSDECSMDMNPSQFRNSRRVIER